MSHMSMKIRRASTSRVRVLKHHQLLFRTPHFLIHFLRVSSWVVRSWSFHAAPPVKLTITLQTACTTKKVPPTTPRRLCSKKPLTMPLSVVTLLLTSKFFDLHVFPVANADARRYGRSLLHFDPKAEAKLRLKIDLMIVPVSAHA